MNKTHIDYQLEIEEFAAQGHTSSATVLSASMFLTALQMDEMQPSKITCIAGIIIFKFDHGQMSIVDDAFEFWSKSPRSMYSGECTASQFLEITQNAKEGIYG